MAVPGLDPGIDPVIHENTELVIKALMMLPKFGTAGIGVRSCVDGRVKPGHDQLELTGAKQPLALTLHCGKAEIVLSLALMSDPARPHAKPWAAIPTRLA